VGLLQRVDLGQGVTYRELFRISGEDPRHERVGDVVEHFLIEPPADESGHALLDRILTGVHQRLAEDGQLGAVREKTRGEELGRRHRKRDQLAPAHDVPGPRIGGGGHQPRFETELREQRPDRRGRSGKGGRPQLGQVAVAPFGQYDAAAAAVALVHDDSRAQPLEAMGRHEPGDPGADDRYRCHAPASAFPSSSSSASPWAEEVNAASKAEGGR
jgi:hypothetical protein